MPEMRMGPNQTCLISAQNIRREHTGIHADTAIFLLSETPPRLLGRDVFNVGRHEDIVRLCRAVHRRLPTLAREGYSLESLENDVLYFCLWLSREWEAQQFVVNSYEHESEPPAPAFILWPYILDGGGTILFGARASGKSYLCIAFAASIANGIGVPWDTEERPVLYVNLERDERSLRRRDYAVAQALHLPTTKIRWLHARGFGMEAVARQVRRIVTPETVVVYDSISRMGLGGLNNDETANRSTDLANWASRTWIAIGHTPRGDDSHLTGSMHFENAADILVRVTRDELRNSLGLGLQIVKANDFHKPPMSITALRFGPTGLTAIEPSTVQEFPALLDHQTPATTTEAKLHELVLYMKELPQKKTDATEAAEALGTDRSGVSRLLSGHEELFVRLPMEGKKQPYGLRVRENV